MKRLCTMREALEDPGLFGAILPGDTWAAWRILLIASQGEPLTDAERMIFTKLTGREREPEEMCDEVWGIIGRRGGKTRAFSVGAAYFAALVDYTDVLAPGQRALLPIMAATTVQANEAFNYLRGIFADSEELADYVESETQDTLSLRNRIDIEVRPANFRTGRGFTAVAAFADEVAFWRIEGAANPDKAILDAVRPALSTTGGPLFVMSSPYAKRGELYANFRRHHGPAGDPRILVAKAPTLTMHASEKLERTIARAMERDPVAARTEYGAEFRDDIADFVSVEVVESCTDPGVAEREPQPRVAYAAFIDPAGGSGADSMTLAIGHREDGVGILDLVRAVAPPFSPEATCAAFAEVLKRYGVHEIAGDNYAALWPKEMMAKHGIRYEPSEKTKGALYAAFLPLLNSRKVRLLDHPTLKRELCALERRTAWGGRDTIDHPAGAHDDVANAAAGVLVHCAGTPSIIELYAKLGATRETAA
jgi:hypothetical protein